GYQLPLAPLQRQGCQLPLAPLQRQGCRLPLVPLQRQGCRLPLVILRREPLSAQPARLLPLLPPLPSLLWRQRALLQQGPLELSRRPRRQPKPRGQPPRVSRSSPNAATRKAQKDARKNAWNYCLTSSSSEISP